MEIIIPFSGFYNSLHDSELDQALEQAFSDRATGCNRNESLIERVQNDCNWPLVYANYAKYYAEAFGEEFKISLTFAQLISPKYYNFETDRILCNIELPELERIFKETDRATLDKIAEDRFTSCSGFSSFYSPDVDSWGDLAEWDHNQAGALIAAYAEQESANPFDQWAELGLMEGASGNGDLIGWIDEATPGIERFYKIHDYLENRKER